MCEDLRLLELPAGVHESFQNGERWVEFRKYDPLYKGLNLKNVKIVKRLPFPRIVIRGEIQEDAVLCTENDTFDLKLADTSNLMLLTPNACLPRTPGKGQDRNGHRCIIIL